MLIVNSLLKINNSNFCPPSHWNQNFEGISDVIVNLTSNWKGLQIDFEYLKLVVKKLTEKHVFWWVRKSLVDVMKFCGPCLMGRDDCQPFHYLAVVAFLSLHLVITEFQCNRFLTAMWCCSWYVSFLVSKCSNERSFHLRIMARISKKWKSDVAWNKSMKNRFGA